MSRFVQKTIQRLSYIIGFFSPKKHSKTAVGIFVFVAVFGVFLVATPVHALGMSDIANAFLWAFSSIMLALARICIALSIFALKFFIEIAQYNGYVDTPTVVLGWTMVRDVANMFFVIILLVIAFATILGVEQYEWKKTLVKLVLAAVFINFSKLICGLIIDFGHVFTITFLSAVSATAGGNLINMFHLQDIYKITGKEFSDGTDDVQIEIFIGAVIALLFAGFTLISMGAYLFVMIARVVVLWVLIILSPIAFIMQVLPTTQSYAKEWWDKFGKQVLVAPVMVFFLWLAFATLGTGDFVKTDLGLNMDYTEVKSVGVPGGSSGESPKVSISDVGTWENMSNFLIAMAFLMVGLGVVNKLGVVGGGAVSSGISFGKKVATIATGYAAGRWMVGKGREGADRVGLAVTHPIRSWAKAEGYAAKAQLLSYGRRPKEQLSFVGKIVGAGVRGYVARTKRVGKMKSAAEQEEKLAFARTEADVSGLQFYQFKEKDAKGRELGDKVDGARDRYLNGVLEAEKERKGAKDKEFLEIGRKVTLGDFRIKGGEVEKDRELDDGTVIPGQTLAERIGKRKEATMRTSGKIEVMLAGASSEMVELKIQKDKELEIAEVTRADYLKNNNATGALRVMRAHEDKWAKKEEELFATLSYTDRVKLSGDLSSRQMELHKKRDEVGLSEEEEEESKSLIRQSIALTSVNNSTDLESSRDGRENSHNVIGWNKKENQANAEDTYLDEKNKLRAEISSILGRVVKNTPEEMEKAMKEINTAYGNNDARQAAFRRYIDSQKKSAMSGDMNNQGIMSEQITEDRDMAITFGEGNHFDDKGVKVDVWDKKTDPKEKGAPKVKQGYVAETDSRSYYAGRLDYRKQDQVETLMTVGRRKDGKTKIVDFSEDQAKSFASMMNGLDSRALTSVPASFWQSLNDIEVDQLEEDLLPDFHRRVQDVIDSVKEGARKDFVKNIEKLDSKFKEAGVGKFSS